MIQVENVCEIARTYETKCSAHGTTFLLAKHVQTFME